MVRPDEIAVEGHVYDARKMAEAHPGGHLFIHAFSGRDASQAFLTYHRRSFPHSCQMAKDAFLERDKKFQGDGQRDHQDFLLLCQQVNKVLPISKSFAPYSYYLKVLFLLGSALSLELYMHYNAYYHWTLASCLGLLFAFIGLNIQHDANHGSISRLPLVNRILGCSQNWIGGSAISWIHQHVVQHHIHTNDLSLDPDIAGSAYVRLNPLKPLLQHHMLQHLYFFLIMALYGLLVVIQSFLNVLHGSHHTQMSPLLFGYCRLETMTSLLFFLRWTVLPLVLKPCFATLIHILPMYVVAGYYLAFFFSLSHNFEGVHMLEATERHVNSKDSNSFLFNQVVSSSNVGGSWLCELNGGLNYQIEHHLFPRIHHSHYPLIAPIVRKFCKEHNVPYVHFEDVWSNVEACARHLAQMGSEQVPKKVVLHRNQALKAAVL